MVDNSRDKNSDKKVVVALTGRADSAVAAFLLKKQGYQVIGLSIVVSSSDLVDDEKFLPKCHIIDLEKVKKFCESIKIPFYATDSKSQFENDVLDKLVSKKLTATANSSCFDCTQMRMDILYKKMIALKADYIATGHYCKVHKNLNSQEFFIHSNTDPKCDQSYLMAGLKQDYLKHLILPLGELRKEEVNKIVKNFNLLSDKSVEQVGFCFRLKESTDKIVNNKVPKSLIKEGQVINKKSEHIYGDHNGIIHHYITESESILNSNSNVEKGLEVVDYDFNSGQIFVGDKEYLTFHGSQIVSLIIAEGLSKSRPLTCYIKFKYSADFVKANLYFKNNNTAYLDFDESVYPLIKGESIVIYDSNVRNSKIIGYAQVGNRGLFKPIDRVEFFRTKNEDDNENEMEKDAEKEIFKF